MTHNLLKQLLLRENIYLDIEAEDRFSLIRKLAGLLRENEAVLDHELLAEDAVVREEEMPTGISNGIALPHARTSAVSRLVLAFARPNSPVKFESSDGAPSDLVFFSAIPPKCIDEYLKMTAHLVRLLGSKSVAERLRTAGSPEEVFEALGLND